MLTLEALTPTRPVPLVRSPEPTQAAAATPDIDVRGCRQSGTGTISHLGLRFHHGASRPVDDRLIDSRLTGIGFRLRVGEFRSRLLSPVATPPPNSALHKGKGRSIRLHARLRCCRDAAGLGGSAARGTARRLPAGLTRSLALARSSPFFSVKSCFTGRLGRAWALRVNAGRMQVFVEMCL